MQYAISIVLGQLQLIAASLADLFGMNPSPRTEVPTSGYLETTHTNVKESTTPKSKETKPEIWNGATIRNKAVTKSPVHVSFSTLAC